MPHSKTALNTPREWHGRPYKRLVQRQRGDQTHRPEAAQLAGDAMLASDVSLELPALDRVASNDESNSHSVVLRQTTTMVQAGPTWWERAQALLRPWLAWIVVVWCLGVVVCSARPLLGWYTLRRLRRVGVSPAPKEVLAALSRVSKQLGLRAAVRWLQSSLARVPIVVGYFRPVTLLPVSLVTSIPAVQLEAILAHELAHVQRHDFAVNLLQTLVETLFFYHPAVWWLSHQIRVEREHCCDDLVVKMLGNHVEYGRALVAIEQQPSEQFLATLPNGDTAKLVHLTRASLCVPAQHKRVWWKGDGTLDVEANAREVDPKNIINRLADWEIPLGEIDAGPYCSRPWRAARQNVDASRRA